MVTSLVTVLVETDVAPYPGGEARTAEANRPVAVMSERIDMMVKE